MSVDTRFLILGDEPNVAETGGSTQGVTEYARMLEAARSLTIRRISLDDFLDYIGYVREEGNTGLGKGLRSAGRRGARPSYQSIGT